MGGKGGGGEIEVKEANRRKANIRWNAKKNRDQVSSSMVRAENPGLNRQW